MFHTFMHNFGAMELQSFCCSTADFEGILCSIVEALVVETAILAHKSLLSLLLVVGSPPNDNNVLPNSVRTDQRFPMSELNKVKEPDAENNDAGETYDDNDDEDEDSDDDDGDESEDESDDDDDSDDEADANGDGDSDDEDDDDDDDDDSDEDDDDNDSDDDEDDEEEDEEGEQLQFPPKRKK